MFHRTNDHVNRFRCKDVSASFARRRAQLVFDAAAAGAKVMFDDGEQFRAEAFNSSHERMVFQACVQGHPYAGGPAIIRSEGCVQYADLLLPRE